MAAEIDRFPVSNIVSQSTLDARFYLAKSGSVLVVGDERFPILGFGCGRSAEEAKNKSFWELQERLFSHRSYLNSSECSDNFSILSWPDIREIKFISRQDFLIHKRGIDSTGFAYGTSKDMASNNAVAELLERNISYRWWYKNEFILSLYKSYILNDDIEIGFFTINSPHVQCSYIVSSICDSKNSIFVCGSSLTDNLVSSETKALQEALMLYESVLHRQSPRYMRDEENVRYLTQADKSRFIDRLHLFESKVYKSPVEVGIKDNSIENVKKEILGDISIEIVVVRDRPNSVLVKACGSGADDIPTLGSVSKQGVRTDPFF